MLNPYSATINELKSMNQDLVERLDIIITLLDRLITETKNNRTDFYGDGK